MFFSSWWFFVTVLFIVTLIAIACRRGLLRPRPILASFRPRLIIEGHPMETIEKELLYPSKTSKPLFLHSLKAFDISGDLKAFYGDDWLRCAREVVYETSRWQLATSWDLQKRMVLEATDYVWRRVPMDDGALIEAIIMDVGPTSVQHAMACHNFWIWLVSKGDRSTNEAVVEEMNSQAPFATAADMIAMSQLNRPLILLLHQTFWLDGYLTNSKSQPYEALMVARGAFRDLLDRIQFVLFLHEQEAGSQKAALESIMRVNSYEALCKMWDTRTYFTIKRSRSSLEYKWYVRTRNGSVPLNQLIRSLCPDSFLQQNITSTGPSCYEMFIRRLLVRNPLELIDSLSSLPPGIDETDSKEGDHEPALTWDALAPLCTTPYWIIHERMASSLAHSLCRIANGEANDREKQHVGGLFKVIERLPFKDPKEQVYWGARHLLLCLFEHFVRRFELDLGIEGEPKNTGFQCIKSLLILFHLLRLEHGCLLHPEEIGGEEGVFLQRYSRFRHDGDEESAETRMIQLSVAWGLAFYPGPPQVMVTWKPSSHDPRTAKGSDLLIEEGQLPLILDVFPWGNPYQYVKDLVDADPEWERVKNMDQFVSYKINGNSHIILDLRRMIFTVKTGQGPDSDLRSCVTEKLCQMSFMAYAKCLANAYGWPISQHENQATITIEGVMDYSPARVLLDWFNGVWWMDQRLVSMIR